MRPFPFTSRGNQLPNKMEQIKDKVKLVDFYEGICSHFPQSPSNQWPAGKSWQCDVNKVQAILIGWGRWDGMINEADFLKRIERKTQSQFINGEIDMRHARRSSNKSWSRSWPPCGIHSSFFSISPDESSWQTGRLFVFLLNLSTWLNKISDLKSDQSSHTAKTVTQPGKWPGCRGSIVTRSLWWWGSM